MSLKRISSAAAIAGMLLLPPTVAAQSAPKRLSVPVEYLKLNNGLKVVFSRDTTAPIAVVAVYYNIGFRNEPRDRTGFAHLFEHMMFQGSKNLGKMEFIKLVQDHGGLLNGSTRFDFTNYFQVVPSHALEPVLWAEADRMRGLAIDSANLKNQQDVVKNEVRVNVLNQPYGGFPWIDLPMTANTNWYNAHNFYGDLEHLDAATLADVSKFFQTFYAPNNAVIVVTGDFERAQTLAWIRKYFESIPSAVQPPKPDLTEPRQTAERRKGRTDPLATRPAVALAYHVPPRNTPEWFAMGLLDQILAQGNDSWLYDEAGAQVRPHGRRDGGDQLGTRQPVRLFGTDALAADLLSRQRQAVGFAGRRHGAGDRTGSHPPRRQGHHRSRAGEDPLVTLYVPRAVRRVRPGEPARFVRALRRRPRAHQPARGRVRRRDARDHPAHRARVSPQDEPHCLHDHAGQDRRRKRALTRT